MLDSGVQQKTGLQTALDGPPGWIGIECSSEEMAVWMLRAVIVEDILARREESVLFVPVSINDCTDKMHVLGTIGRAHRLWLLRAATEC